MEVAVITGRQRIDDARAALAKHERIDGIDVHRVWSTRFGRGSLPGRGIDYLSFYLGAGSTRTRRASWWWRRPIHR